LNAPRSVDIYYAVYIRCGVITVSTTAKLFMHGRSQAVRLPKAFRFVGDEVRVTRIGGRVILEPMDAAGVPWEAIDSVGDRPFMAEGRDQPPMPEDPPRLDG
jgi:antitoxin VapB